MKTTSETTIVLDAQGLATANACGSACTLLAAARCAFSCNRWRRITNQQQDNDVDIDQFSTDLHAWQSGDQAAGDRLYGSAFDELKKIASRALRSHGRADQLHTTVLVNECYLKLATGGAISVESRHHFMALCARAMRQIIVDSARRQLAEKREGAVWQITLSDSSPGLGGQGAIGPESIAALDQALSDLDRRDPRLSRIAECRIFTDMSTAEIAQTFNVTERTVQRDWMRIKALLTMVVSP